MAWIKVARSCDYGPCPTLYVDEDTGAVRVQGTQVPPHLAMPAFEGMLEFPPDTWANLVEQYLKTRRT